MLPIDLRFIRKHVALLFNDRDDLSRVSRNFCPRRSFSARFLAFSVIVICPLDDGSIRSARWRKSRRRKPDASIPVRYPCHWKNVFLLFRKSNRAPRRDSRKVVTPGTSLRLVSRTYLTSSTDVSKTFLIRLPSRERVDRRSRSKLTDRSLVERIDVPATVRVGIERQSERYRAT